MDSALQEWNLKITVIFPRSSVFTDNIQNYLLVSFQAAIMELRRHSKFLHRFLNDVFEDRHANSVRIIFLFFLLQYIRSNEKIHHKMHLSLIAQDIPKLYIIFTEVQNKA